MKMTIQEAMKDGKSDVRLTNHRKWMVWDEWTKVWVVRQQQWRDKEACILYCGNDENDAVNALMEEKK
jgi:hypothetical protein